MKMLTLSDGKLILKSASTASAGPLEKYYISTAHQPAWSKPYFSVFPGEQLSISGEAGTVYQGVINSYGELQLM